MSHTRRNCDNCGAEYMADNRNLKRGWGLSCSKKCAASLRERRKKGDTNVDPHNNNVTPMGRNTRIIIESFPTEGPFDLFDFKLRHIAMNGHHNEDSYWQGITQEFVNDYYR